MGNPNKSLMGTGHRFRGGVLLLLLAVLIFAAHAWHYRGWVEDDSFISFRYARHLAEGQGLVFNPGERVEGFSNPAWVLLSAAVLKVGGDPLPVTQLVGALAGLLVLVLSYALARRWCPDNDWAAGLAPLLLATAPLLPRHAVTGMETVLYALALGTAVWGFLPGQGRGARRLGVAALVLLCWLRPEGLAFALLILLLGRAGRGSWLVVGGAALVLVLGRALYFGALLPNTFHAKVTGQGRGLLEGVLYTVDFLRESGGGLLVGLFLVGLLVDPRNRRAAPLVGGVLTLQVAVVLAAGGDWFHFYRFYTPVYPLLLAAAAAGVGLLHEMLTGQMLPLSRRGKPVVLGAFALTLGVAWLNVYKVEREVQRVVMPHVAAGTYLTDAYTRTGQWLAQNSGPADRVAVSDIGLVGWHSRRPIVDMFGLVDAHIARAAGRQHFKSDTAHVLGRDPDFVVLVRDAQGGYLRVPDQALAAAPVFRAGYIKTWETPVGFRDEVVEVYRRRGGPGGS